MKYMYNHGKLSLALLLALNFLLIFLADHYILTASFYENNGDPFTGIPGSATAVYEALQKWVYFSSAAYLLIKLGIIALIIHTALFLRDQDVSFRKVLKTVVISEFIFLIPAAGKLATFKYTFENGTLLDWHRYHLLSMLWLYKDPPADWYYALQSCNIFEIAYWFVLAFGISKIIASTFDEALTVVVCSYVPAFLIWIASVTFFTLMMFPATS